MNLQQAIDEGQVIRVPPNRARAQSLITTAYDSLDTITKLPIDEKSAKTVTRDLYECLRQVAQAKGYERGYDFKNHAAIQYFLREVMGMPRIAQQFDRLRKIRNGINYYGRSVSIETAQEALREVPATIRALTGDA